MVRRGDGSVVKGGKRKGGEWCGVPRNRSVCSGDLRCNKYDGKGDATDHDCRGLVVMLGLEHGDWKGQEIRSLAAIVTGVVELM